MQKLAVLVLGIMSFGVFSIAHAGGQATMSLVPTTQSAKVGDSFTVTVTVNPNGESLDTARAVVTYPPTMLEVTSVTLGTMFANASPGNSTDNTNGKISYGAYQYGGNVTVSGTLLTLTFHALGGGSATIAVSDDSRLISAGDEKINLTSLGSTAVTVSGTGTATPTATTTTTTTTSTSSSASLEQQALVYFGAFAGRMPSSAVEWEALHCIAYNNCFPTNSADRKIDREAKSLEVYGAKYAKLPSSSMDWNTVHALAYTELYYDWNGNGTFDTEAAAAASTTTTTPAASTPAETTSTSSSTASLEQQALVYFGAFAGHLPASSVDWTALHCIAYDDCYPAAAADRKVDREKQSLVVFGAKYAKLPSSSMDWNTIHALAYTNVFYNWDTVDTTEETAPTTTAAAETTEDTDTITKDEAIGYFGKITGYLPSSSADWLAVDYMVDGYTPSASNRDVDAESAAISKFGSVFGRLPSSSSDWNIIAAIAYSGAIL